MTRPARNRLLLVTLCLAFIATGRWIGVYLGIAVLLAALASFFTAREFFAARSAMRSQRWVDALTGFQRFEASSGSRGPLSWLAMSLYSFDPVAIARNMSGVVHLENGKLDLAEAAFKSSLQKDPGYAVPHLNLAVVAARRKDRAAMDVHLAEAARLGLTSKRAHARVRASADQA
jgi:hypothetical protein